jgi:hypothetical protein
MTSAATWGGEAGRNVNTLGRPPPESRQSCQVLLSLLMAEEVLWAEQVKLKQFSMPPKDPTIKLMQGYDTPVTITLTRDWFVVDMNVPNKSGFGKRVARVYEIPTSAITRVELEGWSGERSEYGWNLATGFLHGAKTVAATTGLTVRVAEGWAIFRLSGPPLAVKPRVDPLLKLVPEGNGGAQLSAPSPQAQASVPQDDLITKLGRLGELRNAGVLTDDEFDKAKQRLLAGPDDIR